MADLDVTNDFVAGNLIKSSEVNTNFTDVETYINNGYASTGYIAQIYTGDGFDTSAAANETDEQEHELDLISAATINAYNANYVQIIMVGDVDCHIESTTGGRTGYVQAKIQEKYSGDSYADIMTYSYLAYVYGTTTSYNYSRYISNITYHYALTSTDKANGVYFKLFSKSQSANGGGGNSSYTNKQVIVKLMR